MADVISIRKTVNELERLEELQRVTASCYGMAIRSTAEYAIEVEPAQTGSFRQYLGALHTLLEAASETGDFEAVQCSFRGELRDYRDKAHEILERLRADLRSAALAMQALAEDISSNSNDHEKQLRADLQRLTKAVQEDDISRLRAMVAEIAESIQRSVAHMNQANQLVIAQLNDEIRSLHRERDNERRTLQTDRASGAWNRDKIEDRIEDLLREDQPFSVVIARVSNFPQIERTCSRTFLEGVLKAMVKRALGVVGATAMVGRWNPDELAVIMEIETAATLAMSAELCRSLSTRYVVDDSGMGRQIELTVASGVLDYRTGGNQRRFRDQLEQLSIGLAAV